MEIFAEALVWRDLSVRAAFLDEACGREGALRRRIEELLRSHQALGDFMAEPAAKPARLNTSVPLVESPGTIIGRYKLLRQIGEGGMGVVYLAEQEEPVKRRVALKIIKLGMDTRQVVALFEAERQALALMDHPNIAKVLVGGATETGRPFFVMELVQGTSITEFCRHHMLSAKDRLKLFIQVCQAIQSAHQKGVIHRDIKPSNVLVTMHDGKPVPKVIDFGIAKAINQRLTEKTLFMHDGKLIGTPAYMIPEQVELAGQDADTRADIYSLGALLYELLTGTTPFPEKRLRGLRLGEMQRLIRQEEPERPSIRLRALVNETKAAVAGSGRGLELPSRLLKGDLDWIVMKCLEKDRARRYETASALARDIQRHLEHETVAACPPSLGYRLRKTARRYRLAFTVAAVVAFALVAGTGVSTWMALIASQARIEAEAAQKEAERARVKEVLIRREAESQLYAAKMNLAEQAWNQNNLDRLRQLLEETGTFPNRGFEWYYWQRKAHAELMTLRGHLSEVVAAAFSPEGRRILTGSEDGTAKVWETAGGKVLLTLQGHSRAISSAAFSPDGRRIVTGCEDGTAKVWEAANGSELLTLHGHTDRIRSAAFSPDGGRIVTGSFDGTAKVWDSLSGRELLTLKGHTNRVNSAAFSPEGRLIVTGGEDSMAKVWEAAGGRELLSLRGHNRAVNSAAFSPDGRRIVTGSDDGTAKVWEAASGRELRTLKADGGAIATVAFSPDGGRIATGGEDRTANVWKVAGGQEQITLRGHGMPIKSVAFSPDGRRLVTASRDGTAKLWDLGGGEEPFPLKAHRRAIRSVVLSPDNRRLVTCPADQIATAWDTATGKKLFTLDGHSALLLSAAFSSDGRRIATCSDDGTAKVWEAASGGCLVTLNGHGSGVRTVAFSPDGRRIVTGSTDQTAAVWETATGIKLFALRGHQDAVTSAAFSSDGGRIVTGSWDKTVKIWDAADGRELLTLHDAHRIYSTALSPDDRLIATGGDNYAATVWEVGSATPLFSLRGHDAVISSVAFSMDGKRIVTGSSDRSAKVWETSSGRELLSLKWDAAGINSVVFSPDGGEIVTGGADGTIERWPTARSGQVTAWQEEERAAAGELAALRRERAAGQERQKALRARDSIKHWLLLAPLPLPVGQRAAEALESAQIEREAWLRPKEGAGCLIRGMALNWRGVDLEDEVIDFNAILQRQTTWSAAYAVCYLRSESVRRGLQLLVGSDDASKIYLNGREVYKSTFTTGFVPEQGKAKDLDLTAGLNVLVFKVVNERGAWKGSVRIVDSQGNPVAGVRVTLDPNEKN